jgi:molybdopterin-guanine dinucleotide biosynthesis protein
MTAAHGLPPWQGRVALAFQAGGRSRRMGSDKAFAPFGDATLLAWMRDRLAPSFPHAFIVANEPARFRGLGLPVVTDALAEGGSAVGIYSAVLASPVERVLCVACDMPFVTARLLRCLAVGSLGHDVYLPRHGAFRQPLCAVYARSALPAFERLLATGERRIDLVYPEVDTAFLDVSAGVFGDPEVLFANVNTPEELESARRRVAAGEEPRAPDEAGLSCRVLSFMERAPVPVVSFVGKKKSGKTTVLLAVVQELVRRGLRVSVVKHDTHGFTIDTPGTDSFRLREAGAAVTGISSPTTYVWISDVAEERSLTELVRTLPEPVDLLITEGFKWQAAPKIEVSRRERSTSLIADADELVAIVSDQAFPGYPVPQLAMEDAAGIADLVEARILRFCGPGGVIRP